MSMKLNRIEVCFFCAKIVFVMSDSIQYTLVFPKAVSDALRKYCGQGEKNFIREAVCERLTRNFGLRLSPVLTRKGQGRRSDLERKRKYLDELNAKLAPYGGAAKVIETGIGAAETSDIIKELIDVKKELIAACPAAQKKQAAAEKEFAKMRAAIDEFRKIKEAERKKQEAKEREAGAFPENGTQEEIVAWYSRSAILFNLKEFDARQKKLAELQTLRETHQKKFIELNNEAVRLAEAFAAGKGAGTAKKHARGNTAAK